MQFFSRSLIIFVVPLAAHAGQSSDFCCLCDDCGTVASGRYNLAIDSSGLTCTELLLEMADPDNDSTAGSSTCASLQSKYYDRCCNENYSPESIALSASAQPGAEYPTGSYSQCDICSDGYYPGNQYKVIAVSDGQNQISGIDTCKDLYWYGKKGMIKDSLCSPIQYYYYSADRCNCAGGMANPPNTVQSGIGKYFRIGGGKKSRKGSLSARLLVAGMLIATVVVVPVVIILKRRSNRGYPLL